MFKAFLEKPMLFFVKKTKMLDPAMPLNLKYTLRNCIWKFS